MRLATRIFEANERVDKVNVKVSKINPPIGGHVKAVAVELCEVKK